MIQKMVFPLLSWGKKTPPSAKKILLSFSTIPSIISINTIIQTSENVFILKEATRFLCALPLRALYSFFLPPNSP